MKATSETSPAAQPIDMGAKIPAIFHAQEDWLGTTFCVYQGRTQMMRRASESSRRKGKGVGTLEAVYGEAVSEGPRSGSVEKRVGRTRCRRRGRR